MNWDDARVFLALGRAQTLRGAARALHVDQATVGRRIAVMERNLGSMLFLRTSTGYLLTAAGEAAFEAAEGMEAAATELMRRTQGLDKALSGEVRVTTTDFLAVDFVIPAMARVHAEHPEVRVVLNSSSQLLNLSRREADIAIRTQKPENPDLIVRRLARWPMGLFASRAYLDSHGMPEPGRAFMGHDLVVYEPHLSEGRELLLVGEPAGGGRIVATVNSSMMMRRAIAAGLGLGEIPQYIGEQDGLVRLWPERERSRPYEVWMVTHADLRHTARIRAVIDQVVQVFSEAGPG
ncbi:LysR family transcriptional regulator [Pseudomonas batumici]|uniref:Transcriptional regulator n=1 Tax=Pseudomonas batumici TaxID=226910 RepID=A0A0C2I2P3_9PSED|nr:LysR family transcriptional regulator [Pseudomonas batumici]KIH83506.1 Transcriptional regulator [Pseudomonas batumici]